jgi:hypothetical protein
MDAISLMRGVTHRQKDAESVPVLETGSGKDSTLSPSLAPSPRSIGVRSVWLMKDAREEERIIGDGNNAGRASLSGFGVPVRLDAFGGRPGSFLRIACNGFSRGGDALR